MREIEFRGRRSYNQEWVKGSLGIDNRKDSHIIQFEDLEECGHHLRIDGDMPMFFDQETIGQYIGREDKNGVKIFEGDIVIAKTCYTAEYNDEPKIYSVSFSIGAFILKHSNGSNAEQWDDGDHEWYSVENMERFDIEVIGNIHENKGLLEVTE